MVAPGSAWPPLSGGRENSAANTNERILDANYDVRQLLNHISGNKSVKVPRPVLEYRLVQAPNKKTLRLYEGLSKPQCAILTQMRTMRIGLRHFLFKIKAAETDRCSCDEGSQTPKHVLLQCPQYIIPRTMLWEQLDRIGIGITEMDYDKIMTNPQATRYVVNFIHRTGLLHQFQYVMAEEDDDEPKGLAAMELGVEDDEY